MQVHILYVDERTCGWCRESGFYWLFFHQKKNKFLRAKGPFATRADAIAQAIAINPSAEVISWDGSLARPNIVTALPGPYQPIFLAA
jgi:hypothetical protein